MIARSSSSRRRSVAGLAACAAIASGLLSFGPLPTSAGAAPKDGDVVPGAYIVTLVDGDPGAAARDHGRRYGASVGHVYRSAMRGYAAHLSEQAAERLASDPQVASVVADRVVRIAAKPQRGGGGSTVERIPTGVRRIHADRVTPRSVAVDVAVLDTGSGPHADLNVAGGVNCSSGSSHADGNGHGTHVAGTIGAIDNDLGVVGVAPGARIWSVRVLNNAGSGTWSSIICGIDWVTADGGIEVANMSLGGTGGEGSCTDGGLHAAICRSVASGVTYVVAAGNESDDAAGHVPATYDEVITVSALADFDGLPGGTGRATCRTDVDDTFADFSNFGPDVDLIAPGVCIESTWKGGGYKTISGTSMASPHVAGAAALYRVADPGASPADVQAALVAKATGVWDDITDPDGSGDKLLDATSL